MTILLVLLPDRLRAPLPDEGTVLDHIVVQGDTVLTTGRAIAAHLPKASECVLLLPDNDVAWHRLNLPKAPRAKLRAVLGHALEDVVLDDPDDLHIALPPTPVAGEEGWVAVMSRSRVTALLRVLQTAQCRALRAHPLSWPGQIPAPEASGPGAKVGYGHFLAGEEINGEEGGQLVWCDDQGVCVWPLAGGYARSSLQTVLSGNDLAAWSAAPAAAEQAQRWLNQAVPVLSDAQRCLQASLSPWQLLQFDLQPAHQGWQHLQRWGRALIQPEWRPARWGLIALVLMLVLGLNARWWQLSSQAHRLKAGIENAVKTTFPEIPVVLDAPLQIRQALQTLRQRTGANDPADFTVLLGAAAAAWPPGAPPAQKMQFDNGNLVVTRSAWSPQQQQAFSTSLREQGLQALDEGDAVRVRLLPPGAQP